MGFAALGDSLQNLEKVARVFEAFNTEASVPFTEQHAMVGPPPVACVVRWNRYDDSTKYPDFMTHSGITYDQPAAIENNPPIKLDVSFQAESGLDDYHMPDGSYYKSNSPWPWAETYIGGFVGVEGVLYDAKYTNWTESVEAQIDDPKACILIKNKLVADMAYPPDFNTIFHNSNDYAQGIWAYTGLPTDYDLLKEDPRVSIIRLEQDLTRGQLQSDYSNIQPAWKP